MRYSHSMHNLAPSQIAICPSREWKPSPTVFSHSQPLQKFSWAFEFSWDSHEILMRKRHSHENFQILMRILHELFHSWEYHFSYESWKLLRFSWDSHETLMRKGWILVGFFSHEIFFVPFSHENFTVSHCSSHENLKRISWESHEIIKLTQNYMHVPSGNF